MANMFDYLSWRGDLTFQQSPFNPVDNIILSQFSYLDLTGIVGGPDEKKGKGITLGEAAAAFAEKLQRDPSFEKTMILKDAPDFMAAVGASKRFACCRLKGYFSHHDLSEEKQFAAISIVLDRKTSFIAFRGTDNSLVGWKEDFNMSFSDEVPAQREAVIYLEKMAGRFWGKLLLGGHSKGGNLAVYAASYCRRRIRRRIIVIYSNDSPGFQHRVIESEGFKEIRDRIRAFVPQSSLVGMLFERGGGYAVVKSSESGLMQHDLYSWEVTHNDMIRLDQLTNRGQFIDKTLHEWINSVSPDQRQRFIDAVYSILCATQAKSLPELTADWFKSTGLMIQSLKNIDESTRGVIVRTFAALFRAAKNNIETLRRTEKKTGNAARNNARTTPPAPKKLFSNSN
jgi:hypothetical protein